MTAVIGHVVYWHGLTSSPASSTATRFARELRAHGVSVEGSMPIRHHAENRDHRIGTMDEKRMVGVEEPARELSNRSNLP